MPELPEVETVKRQLSQSILCSVIEKINLSDKKMRFSPDKELLKNLIGEKILNIHRRNKYLVIETKNLFLVFHLGMSGQLIVAELSAATQKHEHVTIIFKENKLCLVDPRRFGGFLIYDKKITPDYQTIPLFSTLGIEPFEKDYTRSNLEKLLKAKKENIKKFLLDAHNICGIGNIYANEIMFLCKIDPERSTKSLTKTEINNLYKNIFDVLQLAIDNGGSSISDFVHVNGQSGQMQNLYNVYTREGKPCKVCQTKIKKIKQFGRSTFYCPICQN